MRWQDYFDNDFIERYMNMVRQTAEAQSISADIIMPTSDCQTIKKRREDMEEEINNVESPPMMYANGKLYTFEMVEIDSSGIEAIKDGVINYHQQLLSQLIDNEFSRENGDEAVTSLRRQMDEIYRQTNRSGIVEVPCDDSIVSCFNNNYHKCIPFVYSPKFIKGSFGTFGNQFYYYWDIERELNETKERFAERVKCKKLFELISRLDLNNDVRISIKVSPSFHAPSLFINDGSQWYVKGCNTYHTVGGEERGSLCMGDSVGRAEILSNVGRKEIEDMINVVSLFSPASSHRQFYVDGEYKTFWIAELINDEHIEDIIIEGQETTEQGEVVWTT